MKKIMFYLIVFVWVFACGNNTDSKSCTVDEVKIADGTCVDPKSNEHCGAEKNGKDGIDCTAAGDNLACKELSSDTGEGKQKYKCGCKDKWVDVGKEGNIECVDPKTDVNHCGAKILTGGSVYKGTNCNALPNNDLLDTSFKPQCKNGKCIIKCKKDEKESELINHGYVSGCGRNSQKIIYYCDIGYVKVGNNQCQKVNNQDNNFCGEGGVLNDADECRLMCDLEHTCGKSSCDSFVINDNKKVYQCDTDDTISEERKCSDNQCYLDYYDNYGDYQHGCHKIGNNVKRKSSSDHTCQCKDDGNNPELSTAGKVICK